ncbi:MAG: Rab family GTPase [Thermoplasmata archaeon]
MTKRSLKIVLLGDGAVGKTSLVKRFVEQKFSDEYITTIGTNVKKKEIPDLDVKLMIWDMYGQKLKTTLQKSSYKGADGALIVYDITRMKTFESLDNWMEQLFDVTGEIPVVVLGNKYDLLVDYWEEMDVEELTDEDFQEFMEKHHREVIEYYKKVYDNIPEFRAVPYARLSDWGGEKKDELKSDFSFFMTSAKTGENVEESFRSLAKSIVEGEKND